MEEIRPQTITKLDGAERQLRTAIRLFFEEGDMLPVQTLVAAAHEVLFQLSGKKTGGSILKNSGFIRPEMKKKWNDFVNDVPNFLKHAGKDSTKTIEFFPDSIEYWIFDCIVMHEQITSPDPRLRESGIFLGWFIGRNPHVFTPEAFGAGVAKAREFGAVSKALWCKIIKDPKTYPVPGK